MKRKVEKEGWDTQLGVWGRGVDPDLFSPARRRQDLRQKLGLGPNDVAALWLGRVVHEKQPGVWLRVRARRNTGPFRECSRSCPGYYLLPSCWLLASLP